MQRLMRSGMRREIGAKPPAPAGITGMRALFGDRPTIGNCGPVVAVGGAVTLPQFARQTRIREKAMNSLAVVSKRDAEGIASAKKAARSGKTEIAKQPVRQETQYPTQDADHTGFDGRKPVCVRLFAAFARPVRHS